MKNLKWFLILISVVGCQQPNNTQTPVPIEVYWQEDGYGLRDQMFSIIEIDDCEYLVGQYDRGRFITHKGNCKFCAERNKTN